MKRNEEKSYHGPQASNIQQQIAKQTNSVDVLKEFLVIRRAISLSETLILFC